MEISLRARGLKAKLVADRRNLVAVGTSLVLWFGARMVLEWLAFRRVADRLHFLLRQAV